MFDNYSEGALRAIFAARGEAGRLGGPEIEVDHLLAGIVLQDQGDVIGMLSWMGVDTRPEQVLVPPSMETGAGFFAPEVAAALLARMQENARSPALPPHGDMLLSEGCRTVLEESEELARELKHAQITPLHLLAAALNVESSHGAALLREHGITRESVLAKLRSDGGQ
jgi:ATP-dependent Clp protease ATP-binding subunit ClpA